MDNRDRLNVTKDLLNYVQSFFPRVEAKASVILSVDTAMLGLLGITAPPIKSWDTYMFLALIPVAFNVISLIFLYLQLFPQLEGGKNSLIYFRGIVERKEEEFIA